MTDKVFDWVPTYVDHYQSGTYRLVGWTIGACGSVTAHFADGTERPSIYRTEQDLLDDMKGKVRTAIDRRE